MPHSQYEFFVLCFLFTYTSFRSSDDGISFCCSSSSGSSSSSSSNILVSLSSSLRFSFWVKLFACFEPPENSKEKPTFTISSTQTQLGGQKNNYWQLLVYSFALFFLVLSRVVFGIQCCCCFCYRLVALCFSSASFHLLTSTMVYFSYFDDWFVFVSPAFSFSSPSLSLSPSLCLENQASCTILWPYGLVFPSSV